ncbi:GNAT family N-acetyltransferase [Jeotgalibacillus proteolyticus]|uniref:GNAT family N-acetyltransferase n=1 Tax=Jeotgalibacillus proteolyticus TaxID=2082395 RepID=A0A2S5GCG7_9BACL|nr:GNAT family N-acetyltransferase [Jeotgalibacillus proteolyticus]PPA70696.1 GNAT family N-acetyltransferase [Jeotgalibacillus proteolyticus]
MVNIRNAVSTDLPEMAKIYNQAIRETAATFDLREQTLEERQQWFDKYGENHPLIVAEINGEVAGYSSLSPFRDKEAYSRTTELSIYISPSFQGKGVGKSLMKEILSRAESLGHHVVIGGITGGNAVSVRLHEQFGFTFVGCFKEVGYKFDQWQDVHFYQLVLTNG